MNKRNFLKSLFGLAGSAAAAPVVAEVGNASSGLPAGHPYAGMTPKQNLDFTTGEILSVGQSEVLTAAYRFAVMDGKGGAEQPFAIQDGRIHINEAYVRSNWAVKVQCDTKGRRHIAGIGVGA